MKTYTKRLRAHEECVGMVQEECHADMTAFECGIGPMILNELAKQYPDAVLVAVSVKIEGIVMLDAAPTAKGE